MRKFLEKCSFKNISYGFVLSAVIYLFSELLFWHFELFAISSIIGIVSGLVMLIAKVGLIVFVIKGIKTRSYREMQFVFQIIVLAVIYILCSFGPGWILNCFELDITG